MMLKICLVLLLAAIAAEAAHRLTSSEYDTTHCGGTTKKGRVNYIEADGCNNVPCVVHPGSDYSIHVNFTATKDITEVHTKLNGVISGTKMPWRVTPENICGHGLSCPIAAGTSHVFHLDLRCPGFAPETKLVSEWILHDVNNEEIFCFVIPLEIRNRS